jgi:hypothetical protein
MDAMHLFQKHKGRASQPMYEGLRDEGGGGGGGGWGKVTK